MPRTFAIAFDYLCPFARNANEHVVTALRAGAPWEVRWLPYSLSQGHVDEGEPAVWDRAEPYAASGILALAAGLTVQQRFPGHFLDAHETLFSIRHDRGEDLNDPDVVAKHLSGIGVPASEVLDPLPDAEALGRVRSGHEEAVREHKVWGVPTFVTDRRAVFVRLMDRPEGDRELARDRVERVLDLVDGFGDLNEFKQVDRTR